MQGANFSFIKHEGRVGALPILIYDVIILLMHAVMSVFNIQFTAAQTIPIQRTDPYVP